MAAGTLNFTGDNAIEQGATFSRILTWRDENNNLVNLTGYTARMDIRAQVADPTPKITLNTSNGRITLGGAAGTITLLISATDTAALDFSAGVYDLELISGSGFVTRLLEGTVEVDDEVTRTT